MLSCGKNKEEGDQATVRGADCRVGHPADEMEING